MTIEQLLSLQQSGEFHHATYRNQGTLWEGLWIYRRDSKGFRGYTPAGCFNVETTPKDVMDEAHRLCCGSGISVGSYGNG